MKQLDDLTGNKRRDPFVARRLFNKEADMMNKESKFK
jgi:hypothetical protein